MNRELKAAIENIKDFSEEEIEEMCKQMVFASEQHVYDIEMLLKQFRPNLFRKIFETD